MPYEMSGDAYLGILKQQAREYRRAYNEEMKKKYEDEMQAIDDTSPWATQQRMRISSNMSDYNWNAGIQEHNSMGSNWDAFFQSLRNAGVDSLADSSVGAKKGMWRDDSADMPITEDPRNSMMNHGNISSAPQYGSNGEISGYISKERDSNFIGAKRRPATFFDSHGRRVGQASRPYVTQNPDGSIVSGGNSTGLQRDYNRAIDGLKRSKY